MKITYSQCRMFWLPFAVWTGSLVLSCSSSNPTDPDTRAPYVGWILPDVSVDTVFVFDLDTTTIQLNAGDDGGVVSDVKVYLDGALVATLTSAPYRTVLSLAGIRKNRSARVWATASDPTGKIGSTADTLRFVRSVPPDTARWTQLSPTRSPSPRDGFTWELDPTTERALLFGGFPTAAFESSNELWSFDLNGNNWDSLATSGTTPLPRNQHGAGLAGQVMVIFGGRHVQGAADSVLEEYSLLDLGTLTWNSGQLAFGLRPIMAMANATVGTDVFFYGGVGSPQGPSHDTLWAYSIPAGTWLARPNPQVPSPRSRALAVMAGVEEDLLFLYGGSTGRTSDPPADRSNFRLDLGTLVWTSTLPPVGPPALKDAAAVYDSSCHRILVWGGRDNVGGYPVEVWEFTLGRNYWRSVPTLGPTPAGRSGHRLIYDAARNRVVIFGGLATGSWSSETWQLAW